MQHSRGGCGCCIDLTAIVGYNLDQGDLVAEEPLEEEEGSMIDKVLPHNLRAIHDLLVAAFTAKSLRRFCRTARSFGPSWTLGADDSLSDIAAR